MNSELPGRGPVASLAQPADRETCDGPRLRQLLSDATALLDGRRSTIDALNVFPVPDGDTGSNLLLTMRAALAALPESGGDTAGEVAEHLARGALLGARGNSGVILSQYWRGFARAVRGEPRIDADAMARALADAATSARDAVDQPVEGTILTVAGAAASAAAGAVATGASLAELLATVATEATITVERTRGSLPALRRVDVVDAGALGLATLLEGIARSFRGDPLPFDQQPVQPRPAALDVEPSTYGYCTEFVIRGVDLDPQGIRASLARLGDSVLAVGDHDLVRVHLHTRYPEDAVDLGRSLGSVERVKIDDMQAQHQRLLDCAASEPSADACTLLVVADGRGFAELFRSLGAAVVVESSAGAESILAAVRGTVREPGQRSSIILTHDQAIAARLREELGSPPGQADRAVLVLAERDQAASVAAALAFQPERPAAANVTAMTRAAMTIQTAQIVRTSGSDPRLAPGQPDGGVAGLLGDLPAVVGQDLCVVALELLRRLGAADREVVTLYAGRGTSEEAAAVVAASVRAAFPEQEVDLVLGGQAANLLELACE